MSRTHTAVAFYGVWVAVAIIPKRWTLIPGTFGKAAVIDWQTANASTEKSRMRQTDMIRAAQMQHEWAWRLNVYRRAHHLTLPQLAPLMNMTEQRMGDLLRGDSPASLIDLAAAARVIRAAAETRTPPAQLSIQGARQIVHARP